MHGKDHKMTTQPARIIDMHQHVCHRDPVAYVKNVSAIAREHNIQKLVVLGCEWHNLKSLGNNDVVLECWKEARELIVPFAGIDAEWPASGQRVAQLKDQGFVGLKFILPKTTYHDECLYPWYEAAQALKMPVVFHTGIVGRWDEEQPSRVDSSLMRPVYLDTIARAFPDLQLIGAHLGNPWYEEAAMSCRWNPNLYFDLSGGTIIKKKPEYIRELLWWGRGLHSEYADTSGRNAFEKIVFGTDVLENDIPKVIDRYLHLAEAIELPKKDVDSIFYRTAASILRKAGVNCDE